MDNMMDDFEDKLMELEKISLLKDRYYLVLEPEEDEESGFSIRAYATKDIEHEGVYDPTYVVLQGLIGALQENFGDVYEAGLARVSFEELAHVVGEEKLKEEHLERVQEIRQNVIKVDFGKVQ
tara:strand:- start:151 stop:519 length:369 start_codon:yes stop_codon:yes gene_type:complete